MSCLVMYFRKKALTLAIGSVLATATAANWPPNATKTIPAGTTETVSGEITIQDTCRDGSAPCNVTLIGGTLNNYQHIKVSGAGAQTSIMTSGDATINNSSYALS